MLLLCGGLVAAGAARRAVCQRRDRPRRACASATASSGVVADAGFGISEIQITGNRRMPTDTIFAALGLQAGPVDLLRRSAGAPAPASWRWTGSPRPMCVRRYPDAIFVTRGREAALRPVADAARRQATPICGGGAHRRRHHQPGRGEILASCPSWSARARPRPPPIWWMRSRRIAPSPPASPPMQRVSDRRWNLILDDGVVVQAAGNRLAEGTGRAGTSDRRQGHSGARCRPRSICARRRIISSC